MKNKIVIVAVLALVIGVGFVFLSKSEVGQESQMNSKSSADSKVKIQDEDFKDEVKKRAEEASKLNQPDEVDDQMKKWDAEYDRIEKEWNNLVSQLFADELHLEKAVYEDYLKLRDGLSNDKIRAFEAFHKEMEAKYGDNYTYNPTDEELSFERDIQKKYDDVLKEKIGEENFNKYIILRDNYNNTLMEKQNPDDGVILMDF